MSWEPILLIIALIVIDFITGIIGAVVNDSFSSKIMRQGLWHKLAYFIILAVVVILERLSVYYDLGFVNLNSGFGYSVAAATMLSLVIVWIILTEVGSILENIVVINPKLKDNTFMAIFAKREDAMERESRENGNA